ncbi:MAG TPA: NAD(P)H-dependent oxidoreductase subunit E [Vicinamibacterales bacterium]|nr:NAD(P)H-dependent oxidoreductase subunit E [Vicinamibacterales bacterium]
MDIRPVDATATTDERAAVNALLGPPQSAWDGGPRGNPRDAHVAAVGGRDTRARRHLLLPALRALQSRVGWISEGGLGYVCDRLNVPPADAWGVATFYALLFTAPTPRRIVHVCDDIACKARGADAVTSALERAVGPPLGHASHSARTAPHDAAALAPRASGWMRSPCLGRCDRAPAAFVAAAGERPYEALIGDATADRVQALLNGADAGFPQGTVVRQPVEQLRLLRRVGRVDPASIDAYRADGGFAALEKARGIGAAAVIAEVTAAGLLGRGGAAFPTGRKWEAVRSEPATPHYLICNADESEPGTFKDRVLMEEDPFAIVEAMAIAAFATGCERGYVYVRGEYPLAAARLQHAIDAARVAGLLGTLDIEIRRGAGAYICGEETAIFESIEGRRGEPRNKPPFPVQAGLFGKPTVVNNVETLANVPHILLGGAAAFAAVGTAASAGTRLFCLSGNVEHPGVYEAPYGVTLRALIDLAGGLAPGRTLRAVLLGGAAGSFVRPEDVDLRLTHEDTRAAGTTLGSGVVMVLDDSVDLRALVLRIASFFRDESCGQCVPCRVGTIRQEEALHRLSAAPGGRLPAEELVLLDDVGAAMRDASICGLGQTAYSAIESAIKRLHLFDGSGAPR